MTSDKDDGYMGSGLRLKEAIQSFGLEHFSKEILFECESEAQMNDKEREIVDEVFVARLDTYNVNTGGAGGWYACNKRGLNAGSWDKDRMNIDPIYAQKCKTQMRQCRDKLTNILISDPEYAKEYGQKVSNSLRLYYSTHPGAWTGKRHTTESKVAIGRKNAIHQRGSGNSHYGKCWIHNLLLKENTRITPEELPKYQAEGWIKGRRMKFT